MVNYFYTKNDVVWIKSIRHKIDQSNLSSTRFLTFYFIFYSYGVKNIVFKKKGWQGFVSNTPLIYLGSVIIDLHFY